MITALLGPTNTGKTHRAVERMLEHPSGMIGLPLRLLAREVYDRITAAIGEGPVALVTGEEKRVPRRPQYWVCTVEAMPMDHEVDFLAVDEIQLAAHRQRGHVFTHRLLAARGRVETWFMGAETMRPWIERLLPTASLRRHPRLSTLRGAGKLGLGGLRPRTAVVAFSSARVYELAERLRRKKGGAAVVLGALSPRARNAQVALYQSGEVDYLVATDAIGMGLNLAVEHVAFADLQKFDGREARDLEAAELAQIAGRAGRYLADGSFGTLAPLPELPPPLVRAIENHAFPAERALVWRNADLDFASVESLHASLRERPRLAGLRLVEQADDASSLSKLAARPEVIRLARGEEAVSLLWDVCQIPDYRQLLVDDHAALQAEVFQELAARGRLDPAWLAAQVERIDDVVGDIDTLMARIASVRTFTYIAHHARWVDDAAHWQERTRAIEDRLSDALHAQLVARFVERAAAKRPAAPARGAPHGKATARPGPRSKAAAEPARADGPFSRLRELKLASKTAEVAAPRGDAWVHGIVEAAADRFRVDAEARIVDGERVLGVLTRGQSLLRPDVALVLPDDVGPGARSRIHRRLLAVSRDFVALALGPLRREAAGALSAAGRGLVYQLEQGLGTVATAEVEEQIRSLVDADREALSALDVRLGRRLVFVPALLKHAAVERRASLCFAFLGRRPAFAAPPAGSVSFRPRPDVPAAMYAAIGFPVLGGRAIRADVVERVAAALSPDGDGGPAAPGAPPPLASWLGCPSAEVPRLLRAFGFPLAREVASCDP